MCSVGVAVLHFYTHLSGLENVRALERRIHSQTDTVFRGLDQAKPQMVLRAKSAEDHLLCEEFQSAHLAELQQD
jgi:hypothetical protein